MRIGGGGGAGGGGAGGHGGVVGAVPPIIAEWSLNGRLAEISTNGHHPRNNLVGLGHEAKINYDQWSRVAP